MTRVWEEVEIKLALAKSWHLYITPKLTHRQSTISFSKLIKDDIKQANPTSGATMSASSYFFSRPSLVFGAAVLFRVVLLIYGRWQDANSPMKYTDIDYLVFTDAARFMSRGRSPYDRATYRYTPLLAWLLLPTTWDTKAIPNNVWFDFGKALFAGGDIVTGWFIMRILVQTQGMDVERAMKYASLWLLNPMVANISTRGSSEGLVAVIVIALLWAVLQRRVKLAGILLGLGVHFKIYPFIYAASIWWWLGSDLPPNHPTDLIPRIKGSLTKERLSLATQSFCAFMVLNCIMYFLYVSPFRAQGVANMLQLWIAVHRTQLPVSFHSHRSPPQLLSL